MATMPTLGRPLPLLLLLAHLASAQKERLEGTWPLPSAAELRRRYEAKLRAPFAARLPWRRRFREALAEAQRRNTLVLVYSTRSYAPSPPCEALEKGPLLSAWWLAAAQEFVPYLNVEARLPDVPDQGLLVRLGGRGFPYAALVAPDGRVLAAFRPLNRAALATARTRAFLAARLLRAPDPEAPHVLAGQILLGALQNAHPPPVDVLDSIARCPHIDPAILALYDRHRGPIVQWTIRSTVAAALRWLPAAGRAGYRARNRRVYELYRQGFRIEPEEHPSLEYATVLAAGAAEAGDREVALRYLRVAEEVLAEILARNRALAEKDTLAGYGLTRHRVVADLLHTLWRTVRRGIRNRLGPQ